MLIIATSFHIEAAVAPDVLAWLRRTFIPAAERCGLSDPMLAQIISANLPSCGEDSAVGYTLHLTAADAAAAERFLGGVGASLLAIMAERWGQRALAFSTFLEPLPL